MAQHGIELRLEALAVPVAPARAQARLLAQEAPLPVGKEAARDDRGVVRPVLEQQAVALVQPRELLLPVGLVAREENHVMRALDRLDRIDLHEAEMLDQRQDRKSTRLNSSH